MLVLLPVAVSGLMQIQYNILFKINIVLNLRLSSHNSNSGPIRQNTPTVDHAHTVIDVIVNQ